MLKMFSATLLSLCFVSSTLASCLYNEPATTKTGYYGAITPEVYQKMLLAVKNDKEMKMERLISESSVIKIPADIMVCISRSNQQLHLSQIKLPDKHFLYWIPDDVLIKAPASQIN